MGISETMHAVSGKIWTIRHMDRDYYEIQLDPTSPAYEVLLADDGKLAVIRPVEGQEGSFEDYMALEKALCIKTMVYRKFYGAMEHFWK